MLKRRNHEGSPLNSPIHSPSSPASPVKRSRTLTFSADNALFTQIETWVIRNCHQTARAVMEAARNEVRWTVYELHWFLDMLPRYLKPEHKVELQVMRSVGFSEYSYIQNFHMWVRSMRKTQSTDKDLSGISIKTGDSSMEQSVAQLHELFDDDHEKAETAINFLSSLYELRGAEDESFNGSGFVVGMLYSCRHSWLFARDERVSYDVMACLLRVISQIKV